ncbi:MAG: hypothetical protein HY062_18885 [Bacteroidetes bacterium]|nr:hypothetical protein [Bacteroidota bacterium]
MNQKGGIYMSKNTKEVNGVLFKQIFCKYIVKNGKRIYPKRSKFFSFWVKVVE